MANKIVEIMQYNGSTSDNLIPQKAQQADNAINAINAQNAVIGQYASIDTSKGTIEQRLENIETGEISSISLSNLGSNPLISSNIVKRQCNLCIIKFEASSVDFSVSPTFDLGTIGEDFRPSSTQKCFGAAITPVGLVQMDIDVLPNGIIRISVRPYGNSSVSGVFMTIGFEVPARSY